MSRDKLIIAGVVLLGLLGVLVYEQARKDESLGKPQTATADFPSVSAPDDVDKISVTNGDKAEVLLERVPDDKVSAAEASDAGPATKWVLVKPMNADANQSAVKDLLANLKDLKVSSQINLHLDDAVRKDKQLDPAHAVHVVAWKGDSKKADDLFGKSGAAGELVIAAEKPDAVYAAKGYSAYLYAKEAKDFRDRSIFKFEEQNFTQLGLTNAHGTFAFTKGDKWTGTLGGKPIDRFDSAKVEDLVRATKGLNADDFGDGKTLPETGLDKPAATLTIHVKDDPKAYELLLGNVSTGTDRFAKRADQDAIYQLTSYVSDLLTGDVARFQAASDAGAGDGGTKVASAKPKK